MRSCAVSERRRSRLPGELRNSKAPDVAASRSRIETSSWGVPARARLEIFRAPRPRTRSRPRTLPAMSSDSSRSAPVRPRENAASHSQTTSLVSNKTRPSKSNVRIRSSVLRAESVRDRRLFVEMHGSAGALHAALQFRIPASFARLESDDPSRHSDGREHLEQRRRSGLLRPRRGGKTELGERARRRAPLARPGAFFTVASLYSAARGRAAPQARCRRDAPPEPTRRRRRRSESSTSAASHRSRLAMSPRTSFRAGIGEPRRRVARDVAARARWTSPAPRRAQSSLRQGVPARTPSTSKSLVRAREPSPSEGTE